MAKKNKKTYRKPRSAADKMVNAVLSVIVVAFLALAVVALYPKVNEKIETQRAEQEAQEPMTVTKMADELGITAEEFITKYNLDPETIKADTEQAAVLEAMKVRDYYQLSKDMNAIAEAEAEAAEEEAPAESEAPAEGEAAEGEAPAEEEYKFPETFEDFVAENGLDMSEVNDDMSAMEFQSLMIQKMQEAQAAQEAAAAEEAPAEEAQADTSAPAAELAE